MPENFLNLNDEKLKQIGFSRQKTQYGRALACAMMDKSLDLPGLAELEDREAKALLMRVKGICPWTADIYLLMVSGRPDILPKGELALKIAFQRRKRLSKKPAWEDIKAASIVWQPWRAVAARLLWHFYLSTKKNKEKHEDEKGELVLFNPDFDVCRHLVRCPGRQCSLFPAGGVSKR